LANGGETKQEHASGQPISWTEFLENNVGWNLKEDIWHKENDQGSVVLVVDQLQFGGQTKDISIGDIDSTWN